MKIKAPGCFLRKIVRWKHRLKPDFQVFYGHRVKIATEEDKAHTRILNYAFCAEPDSFETWIKAKKEQYCFLAVDDILKEKIPPKAALLTFDDGYKDIYTNAYPILKKHQVPAVVFLITDHVGSGRPFWWDEVIAVILRSHATNFGAFSLRTELDQQKCLRHVLAKAGTLPDDQKIDFLARLKEELGCQEIEGENLSWEEVREMKSHGIQFGSHTLTHPVLTRVSVEKAQREIRESKIKIERETGEEVKVFSYPHGEYNERIRNLVRQAGYRCAFTTQERANHAGDDLFELGRRLF